MNIIAIIAATNDGSVVDIPLTADPCGWHGSYDGTAVYVTVVRTDPTAPTQ
ncbi:hypothetical protein H7I53_13645 [Mycolicibacterium pulveris]|uniref:Uncharacterized protein n=1 Tax=Mycolicibacterium pulveris TaxID=36813 RepID=A0A7I7UN70_MYCPV|nr:hypothetical protein [Mycolicibacterium pulveris]MCV6981266.1 hypothetical protein [Mycolicibacterium pulveris]BBY82291.1 hypothetical protein MPUL_34490 [Mycolicibacterium pulveris]